jgi:hypothetical protein
MTTSSMTTFMQQLRKSALVLGAAVCTPLPAKGGNWQRAKRTRESFFHRATPLRPPIAIGGRGRIPRELLTSWSFGRNILAGKDTPVQMELVLCQTMILG